MNVKVVSVYIVSAVGREVADWVRRHGEPLEADRR